MISLDVSTAMTTPVRTIPTDYTAAEAAHEMRGAGIGSLVVEDEDSVVGIVTQSDVIDLIADGTDVAGATVTDIMSTPVVTVERNARVLDAAESMKEHSVRRLPVCTGERTADDTIASDDLAGIVSTTDLTHYLPRLRNTILRERGGKNTVDGSPAPQ